MPIVEGSLTAQQAAALALLALLLIAYTVVRMSRGKEAYYLMRDIGIFLVFISASLLGVDISPLLGQLLGLAVSAAP